MKRRILPLLCGLLLFSNNALAVGLTPDATRMDVIKYTAIFLFGCVAIFLFLIRLTIIPFLVKSYYTLADATNIGLSLFILYALNLFTLLFFRYSLTSGWRLVFLLVAVFWLIHLLLKVLLARGKNDD